MVSSQDEMKILNEDEIDFLRVLYLPASLILPMVLKAAVELDLFEIMAKAGPGSQLSSAEIATHLPTKNPEAPVILDRMLRFLVTHNYLTCSLVTDEDGHAKRLYSLAPICKYYVRDQNGVSCAPLVLLAAHKVHSDSWYHLKDAVLDGGIMFNKAYGMHAFEYTGIDKKLNEIFSNAMYGHSTISMKKILETYKGFEGVKEVVDVGGGFGAMLASIVSKYPNIKGINFDLPHVIKDAPACPGVEHVGGDMFQSVPKGEVIFMKWILHSWSDEDCLKLLKNCWNALPESGKVIVVETLLPEFPEMDLLSKCAIQSDMGMMAVFPGGKERSEKEFQALGRCAGFAASKIICRSYTDWIIEFYKNI